MDLGFEPSHAAAISVDYDDRGDAAKRGTIWQEIIRRVEAIPGIETAGISDNLPLSRNRSWGIQAKGQTYQSGELQDTFVFTVSPGYLKAIGMRLVKGRDFRWDDNSKSQAAVIVNETVARKLWTHLPSDVLASSVMGTLRQINPGQPATAFRPIQGLVDHAVSPRRFFVLLVDIFAGLGLLLASLGIYGVISYSVTQRTQEIGIRMALGASRWNVQFSVIWKTLRLVLLGRGGRTGGVVCGVAVDCNPFVRHGGFRSTDVWRCDFAAAGGCATGRISAGLAGVQDQPDDCAAQSIEVESSS